MINLIKQYSTELFDEVVKFRRHLHQYPELSYQEVKTTDFIEKKLQEADIPTSREFGNTGVVGFIHGRNSAKKCIAIRADIDALPISEENKVSYKSENEGIMHACGHDVHSANLYGTALILNQLKNRFEGTIKLIFQPAEEQLPGGASVYIKNGVLENPKVETIFGLHVFPDLLAGQVGFRPGLYMASSDELHITIHGKGGHAALAKNLKDPIEAMNHLLIQLRSALHKHQEPTIPYVIGFGNVEAKGATNVIPNVVKILGTFRTMDEQWRTSAHQQMQKTAEEIEQKFGIKIDLDIKKGYPCLNNHEQLTLNAKESVKTLLGEEQVFELPLRMSSEDFAYYTHHTKACFFRLGTSNTKQYKHAVHTPVFNIDEQALLTGMRVMSWLAIVELTTH